MDNRLYQNSNIQGNHNKLAGELVSSTNYREILKKAKMESASQPDSLSQNPLVQILKNPNLTREEKAKYIPSLTNLLPSTSQDDIYYQWIAPSRATIKRDKQWYWNVALICIFIVFFALIAKNTMLIAVILALLFALYVNASVPAPNVLYKLTKQGIEVGEGTEIEIFPWVLLLEYAYYYKEGQEIMYVYTLGGNVARLEILYSEDDRKIINTIMEMYLPYKKPPQKENLFTRWLDGLYIPLTEFKELQQKIDEIQREKYSRILTSLKQEGKVPQEFTVDDILAIEEANLLKLTEKVREIKEKSLINTFG